MPKRIVVCSDGTWNTPDQRSGGSIRPTNVVKLARAIAPTAPDGKSQSVFYDQGVGTEGNLLHRLIGGASGQGLDKNIQDGYRFLMHNYEVGDEIFLLGFSRGAYTVRSLAGLLRNCGLLHTIHAHRLPDAFDLYRREDAPPKSDVAEAFRASYSREVEIMFLGVWDTVGALGIPSQRLGHLTNPSYEFHDVELSGSVKHGYHALSIDERRAPFKPALWEWKQKEGQHVEQVWFVGFHSDVGGGTSDPGLSDVAFTWMKEKATAAGLAFDGSYVGTAINPNPASPAHDSKTGIFRFTGTFKRSLGHVAPTTEAVHPAVVTRHKIDPPPYSPSNLVEYLNDPNHKVSS